MNLYVFDNDSEHLIRLKSMLAQLNEKMGFEVFYNAPHMKLIEAMTIDSHSVILTDTSSVSKSINTFSFCKMIREKDPLCHIIFMSGSTIDVMAGMKNLIRPSGFLLKPVVKSELSSLLTLITRDFDKRDKKKMPHGAVFNISTQHDKYIIPINDILYFTTTGKKAVCCTVDHNRIEFYSTLYHIEERNRDFFIRCHSGFLVNRAKIKSYSIKPSNITLYDGGEIIPVSEKYRRSVSTFFNELIGQTP